MNFTTDGAFQQFLRVFALDELESRMLYRTVGFSAAHGAWSTALQHIALKWNTAHFNSSFFDQIFGFDIARTCLGIDLEALHCNTLATIDSHSSSRFGIEGT